MTSTVIDALSGFGSYGLSALIKLFYNHSENLKTERETFYKHSLAVQKIKIADVQNARAYNTDGTRWTRRILAMIVPVFFLTLACLAFMYAYGHHTPVSMLVKNTHHFLFVSWVTNEVVQLQGLAYFDWMPQLFFMICGFYFGGKGGSK